MLDLNAHPADTATAPIVGQSWDVAGPRTVPAHRHRRGQIIYTERGCVTVEVEGAIYVVPPHRAIWVPPATLHTAQYPREVAFRGIFIDPSRCGSMPKTCALIQVDALTRELIRAAAGLPWDYAADSAEARLAQVLLDRINTLPGVPLTLPGSADEGIARVMAAMRADPSEARTTRAWAELAHMSERTLLRRFKQETGMSLSTWRTQLRLVAALERLAAGESVTAVALALGYRTPSSFTTMFRKNFGVTPRAYFADN